MHGLQTVEELRMEFAAELIKMQTLMQLHKEWTVKVAEMNQIRKEFDMVDTNLKGTPAAGWNGNGIQS